MDDRIGVVPGEEMNRRVIQQVEVGPQLTLGTVSRQSEPNDDQETET
jgi:hypothetical protein